MSNNCLFARLSLVKAHSAQMLTYFLPYFSNERLVCTSLCRIDDRLTAKRLTVTVLALQDENTHTRVKRRLISIRQYKIIFSVQAPISSDRQIINTPTNGEME